MITLLLCVLTILKQSYASNLTEKESKLSPRWTFNEANKDDYYDDEEDYGRQSASNYMSMKVKPQSINSYQPVLLVPDKQQPVQTVIVAKVNAAKPVALKNPYDTPPGTFTKASYGGPVYGKKKKFFL